MKRYTTKTYRTGTSKDPKVIRHQRAQLKKSSAFTRTVRGGREQILPNVAHNWGKPLMSASHPIGKRRKVKRYKSAKTGHWCSKAYALKNPDTTFAMMVNVPLGELNEKSLERAVIKIIKLRRRRK